MAVGFAGNRANETENFRLCGRRQSRDEQSSQARSTLCSPDHRTEEAIMAFAPGDVVTLKSGGHSMTVVSVGDDDIDCLWIGDDGELFRQSIPAVALSVIELTETDEEEDEAEEEEEGEEGEDEESADDEEEEE
jgi:uncharacterized protein YodC (DUF2158 family)